MKNDEINITLLAPHLLPPPPLPPPPPPSLHLKERMKRIKEGMKEGKKKERNGRN